jgi:hypothetical protein
MSAPFQRDPLGTMAAESLDDRVPWTAGKRLDAPLRMAASFKLTLDRFSTGGARMALAGSSDPLVRLILDAVEVCGDRSAGNSVADAPDLPLWTAALAVAARPPTPGRAVGRRGRGRPAGGGVQRMSAPLRGPHRTVLPTKLSATCPTSSSAS